MNAPSNPYIVSTFFDGHPGPDIGVFAPGPVEAMAKAESIAKQEFGEGAVVVSACPLDDMKRRISENEAVQKGSTE